jgi:FkbM family methyltransferase
MSTTARRYWLKALRAVGVKQFRATSGLGLPYVCHVGDFAGEVPFLDRRHSVEELSVMAEWCRTIDRPVIFDIGANNGFIATQLAQLLKDRQPRIYAFEPIPSTFAQLRVAIAELHLAQSVTPVCCAISDSSGLATLAFNPRESLFAQVRDDTRNPRAGTQMTAAAALTVDQVVESSGIRPHLLKIDVEGLEPRVLTGARELLKSPRPPAICLEWNPLTLSEVSGLPSDVQRSLKDFDLYYVNDFEGQKIPFLKQIFDLTNLAWTCNLFAVPANSEFIAKLAADEKASPGALLNSLTIGRRTAAHS